MPERVIRPVHRVNTLHRLYTEADPAFGKVERVDDLAAMGGLEAKGAFTGNSDCVLAFAVDDESAGALRRALGDCLPSNGLDVRRGNLQAAIKVLQKIRTPDILIVDVTGEPHPIAMLHELFAICNPEARIFVFGDRGDLEFYRHLIQQIGVVDYLPKPLLADIVWRHFGALISDKHRGEDKLHGARVASITGARGGVGATTIAVNLAWHLSVQLAHYTLLLDTDLHRGTAAELLGAEAGTGLRTALEAPERIDAFLVERSARTINARLHVLATTDNLSESPRYVEGAAPRLLNVLRRRYNYIILDTAFSQLPFNRAVFNLAHKRIIVMEPTLACARDTLRLLKFPSGLVQSGRPVVVLNRSNAPGGLTSHQLQKVLGFSPDISIPDLPELVTSAAARGAPAVSSAGPFRTAIADLATAIGLPTVRRIDRPAVKPKRLLGLLR